MECERRKVYVEVNVTHRPDGTARPNSIKFENDEIYEVDRVMQKCRAAATKVGGTGIRYTVQICGQSAFLFEWRIFDKVTMTTGNIEIKCPKCGYVNEIDLSLRRGNLKFRTFRINKK